MKMHIHEYIAARYDYTMKYNEPVITTTRHNSLSFIKAPYFY